MDTSNWRSQLQPDSRERAVNRILDALKSHIQFFRDEMHHELEKIAVRFEEDVYIIATTQSDYMRKICFKILTIETTPHNIVYPSDPASLYSRIGEDWQEEVFQKIKAMKDLYLPDLNYMHQKILCKLQQHESLPQQLNNEQIEKLKVFKNMLERFMAFLQIPKHNILPNYKDKLTTYQKQIVHVITSHRRYAAATSPPPQPQPLPPPQMHYVQQNMVNSMQPNFNIQPGQNRSMNGGQQQLVNINPIILSHQPMASLDLTDQMGNDHGGDWQEEVYKKIKSMKDLYLPDLNDMHQKILGKLQQHDSLPQQVNKERIEKLKVFKNMLERFMAFLQIPKEHILPNHIDKLSTYEKQIVHVISSKLQRPVHVTQQLPPPHMHCLQQNMVISMQPNFSIQPGQSSSMNGGQQLVNINPIFVSHNRMASSDLTAQIGNANGGDWQEDVYQKIKAMKDLYLLDLNDMHQKILGKLQQQSNNDKDKLTTYEKLKVFKNMLERFMAFLQIPKHNILPNHKDKLATYEKQIVHVITSNHRHAAATYAITTETFPIDINV